MPRFLPTLALAAALALGGCRNPDGSTDWGSTLLLGAGIGATAALLASAASGDRATSRHPLGPRQPVATRARTYAPRGW